MAGIQGQNLTAPRYGVAVSWDHTGTPIDVDLQAVVVDRKGSIVDAVYYNNMKALRCMTHSGDEQTGERAGFDETIWIGLSKMPDHVQMVIFVVAAYTGGHLRDVKNGIIHVLEETKDREIGRIPMERSQAQVDVVAMIVRSGSAWAFHVVEEPATQGQHFIDVLEPTIGNLIRRTIPGAPRRQKVAFAMEKGALLDLPATRQLSKISAGLGWDVTGEGVDLDVSAVLFDGRGTVTDTVFFGKLNSSGLRHSGDNLTGAGDGDDETIECHLDQVPEDVQQIFFVVNIYTRRVNFQSVKNAYCRIVDSTGSELARYLLREGGAQSGLIIARLIREPGERWGFQALGSFSNGSMWKDAVPDMTQIFHQTARDLQRQSTSTLPAPPSGGIPQRVEVVPVERVTGKDPCCALQ